MAIQAKRVTIQAKDMVLVRWVRSAVLGSGYQREFTNY
jgi:histone H3/H4